VADFLRSGKVFVKSSVVIFVQFFAPSNPEEVFPGPHATVYIKFQDHPIFPGEQTVFFSGFSKNVRDQRSLQ
jgi:hypothetical protein